VNDWFGRNNVSVSSTKQSFAKSDLKRLHLNGMQTSNHAMPENIKKFPSLVHLSEPERSAAPCSAVESLPAPALPILNRPLCLLELPTTLDPSNPTQRRT
jgi:hypothetical protein